MARKSTANKPLHCEKCTRATLDLTFYKKEWWCTKCLNKDTKGSETDLRNHTYRSGALSWEN